MGTFDDVCHQRLCGIVSVNKIVFFLVMAFNKGNYRELGVFK